LPCAAGGGQMPNAVIFMVACRFDLHPEYSD
jgi:hypothetical protein